MRAFSAIWDRLRGFTGQSQRTTKRSSKRMANTVLQGRRAILECLEERALLSVTAASPQRSLLADDGTVTMVSDDALLWSAPDSTPSGESNGIAGSPSTSSAPFGATDNDTTEYLIGNVYVTVVLFESNGTIDANRENWTPTMRNQVKAEIQEGLQWWVDTYNARTSSTTPLYFDIDFTYADTPVSTGYEPITQSAMSNEYLWISDFLQRAGRPAVTSRAGALMAVRDFDADQRDSHNCDWAFTVFIANSANDFDGCYSDGSFAYAYVGGPWVTMTYTNDGWGIDHMGQVLAHETGHIFYALDEYPGSGCVYTDYSGYYNVQNVNAYDGHPNRSSRVASIMAEEDLQNAAYAAHTSSPSSLQAVGLRDTDGDGILDVLDVPLTLTGSGSYNASSGVYTFSGHSAVQTLVNRNPYGMGNDITLNKVDLIQYRVDSGAWVNGHTYGGTDVDVSQAVNIASGRHTVEFRTICSRTGVTSAVWTDTFDSNTTVTGTVWSDENADGYMSFIEPRLANWTVYVDADNDGVLDAGETTATTNSSGVYTFSLLPGTYTIREVLQSGWLRTLPVSDSYVVTGTAGQLISGRDFGNVQAGTISGKVWNDLDAGADQDAGEPGLAGWTVFIDDDIDGVLDAGETFATADTNGNYSITGLRPGNIYWVREVLQAGWECTYPATSTHLVYLSANQTYTADFGNNLPTGISGTVWEDLDGDGVRDAGEPGLSNWMVYLDTNNDGDRDVGESLTWSNSQGVYIFKGLSAGTYYVREVLQSNWRQTLPTSGYYQVTLAVGSAATNRDFGNQQLPGTITGRVWEDLNNNQTYDSGETLLANCRVYVDRNNNNVYDSGEWWARTDGSGVYSIANVAPGTYAVREDPPTDYLVSSPASGYYSVTVPANSTVSNRDFGNLRSATIGGQVWNDYDGDGAQDAGENGLVGWTVYWDANANASFDVGEQSAITNISGVYSLKVLPGSGTVREVLQNGWMCSFPATGGHPLTVSSSETVLDQNFGNYRPGTFTGLVWDDEDADGLRDLTETGLSGWQVYVDKNNSGDWQSGEPTATTDSNGNYSFTLLEGTYTIRHVVQNGYVTTAPTAGYHTVTLRAGETNSESVDFGDVVAGYINGSVWNDLNADGIRSAGEGVLSGWTVYLDANNNKLWDQGELSAVSNAFGAYSFTVAPGTYVVREYLEDHPGWVQAWPNAQNDYAYTVTVGHSQTLTGADFGNVWPGAISGTVWEDRNGNGFRDPEETNGLGGWIVYVDLDHDGLRDSSEPYAVTNNEGIYTIEGVIAGSRTVREVLKRSWKQTHPVSGSFNVTVAAGVTTSGVNFGNRAYGAITGIVWNDAPNALGEYGTVDPGEAGLSGWQVFLDENGDDLSDRSTSTDAYGYYSFGDLPAGDYAVWAEVKDGWWRTVPGSGTTSGFHPVTIAVGQVNNQSFGNCNLAPTITGLAATASTQEDTPVSLSFTLDDRETNEDHLIVNVSSSNTALVPAGNLVLVHSGADCTLSITPTANNYGTTTITVTVTDRGGSTISRSFVLTVQSVNDAPVLTSAGTFSLGSILEDATSNVGVLVSELIASAGGNPITDLDTGALEGIAIVGTDSTNGTWRFSLDDGVSWNNVGSVSAGEARLLAADSKTRIRFVPGPNFYGSVSAGLTFHAWDQNGVVNGLTAGLTASGTGGSSPFSVNSAVASILVVPVNDAPTFAVGEGENVAEDSGPHSIAGWATNVSPGADNELGQALTFDVWTDNPAYFATQPAVDPASGTLTYTLAADVFGTVTVSVQLRDSGGTENGGSDSSAVQTFTINIGAVNDMPSFVKGANQLIDEDGGALTVPGWATAIAAGPSNESDQTLEFLVTTDNDSLFSVLPAISANGTLTYTPAADAFGTATVTVQLRDNGGGSDTSPVQTFTITVSAVNDQPSFVAGISQVTNEDSGPQSVDEWATDIYTGAANESGQVLDFQLTTSNDGLFSVLPAISADGTLTYTPAPNAVGTATVTVRARDWDAGTPNDIAISAAQTFAITLRAVNDAPSFTKGANQTVTEDAPAQSIPGWATNLSAGAANEAGQTLDFLVTTFNPEYFAVQPAISVPGGTLTYQLAPNAEGVVTVIVRLHDNGGTDNGGQNTSAEQTFTITINAVNDPPSFVKGPDVTVNSGAGLTTIDGWATDIAAGGADESGQVLTFHVNVSDPSLFATLPTIDAVTGSLTFAPLASAAGTVTVTVSLSDNAGGQDTSAEQTFTIRIVSSLGELGMRALTALDATTETLWYSLETTLAGYLTAEAVDSAATLALYDQNMQLVAASKLKNGNQRIDFPVVGAGETYYLSLSGGDGSVDLRVLNLVQAGSGGALLVSGTAASDTLKIDGANGQITINGVVYSLSPTSISFDGGAGNNTVEVLGTSANDQFLLNAATGQMTLNKLTATFVTANVRQFSFDGLGGKNAATLIGTSGSDVLMLDSSAGQLLAGTLRASVSRTATISAYGGGGTDAANLYGSAASDVLKMSPSAATLVDSAGTYSFTVNAFATIIANGRAGVDQVSMYDSASNDTFVGTTTYSRMYTAGGAYSNRATAFELVYAYASTGTDTAWLYDSTGNDSFVSNPTYSTMSGQNFSYRARAFDYVYGIASQGTDSAVLYDSERNDTFTASPTEGTMQGTGYVNRAKGFDTLKAYASSGYDRAYLYDSVGIDTLQADSYWVKLYNTSANYSILVSSFDRVYAYSSDTTARNIKKIGPNLASNMLYMLGAW